MKLNKKLAVVLSFFVIIGFGGAFYFNHYHSDMQKLTRNYALYNLATSEDLTKNIDLANDVPLVNIRRLAETEPLAQFALGLHYKKDNKEELAKQWFKKAVDNQFAPAYVEWAMIIEKESPKESEEYLQQAAEKGVNLAKWKLYKKMEDKEDYLSAMLYIEEMAKQGIPTAMYKLSDIYRDGKGVAVDLEQSFNWLNKAYQQASKYDKQVFPINIYRGLANRYILGAGVTRDEKKAQEILNQFGI